MLSYWAKLLYKYKANRKEPREHNAHEPLFEKLLENKYSQNKEQGILVSTKYNKIKK